MWYLAQATRCSSKRLGEYYTNMEKGEIKFNFTRRVRLDFAFNDKEQKQGSVIGRTWRHRGGSVQCPGGHMRVAKLEMQLVVSGRPEWHYSPFVFSGQACRNQLNPGQNNSNGVRMLVPNNRTDTLIKHAWVGSEGQSWQHSSYSECLWGWRLRPSRATTVRWGGDGPSCLGPVKFGVPMRECTSKVW